MGKTAKPKKKKLERRVDKGIVNISTSFNNTIINLSDRDGNTLAWATAGSLGFKGAKKATPFAASQIARKIADKAQAIGMTELEIKVQGVGTGREQAVRALVGSGFTVNSIQDVTPIPHGGVRPKKVRRV
ncbi:MAG: 30S ribosomal protein S11 [Candidatus Berkelbacteria bacterium]|nr:30S ribosomal protein S11 [Candidatus Berkelbacteria bacterium]